MQSHLAHKQLSTMRQINMQMTDKEQQGIFHISYVYHCKRNSPKILFITLAIKE